MVNTILPNNIYLTADIRKIYIKLLYNLLNINYNKFKYIVKKGGTYNGNI